jgi:hypothetical protein
MKTARQGLPCGRFLADGLPAYPGTLPLPRTVSGCANAGMQCRVSRSVADQNIMLLL